MNGLSKKQFNEYIDEFVEIIMESLFYRAKSGKLSKMQVVNHIKKKVDLASNEKGFCTVTTFRVGNEQYQNSVLIEFTLSYDNFYSVPVLYFHIFEEVPLEESFESVRIRPIHSLEDIATSMNSLLQLNDVALSLVTLDTHYQLADQTVWFYIHPCQTQIRMDELIQSESEILNTATERDKVLRYLYVWFGTCGLGTVFNNISLRSKPPINRGKIDI